MAVVQMKVQWFAEQGKAAHQVKDDGQCLGYDFLDRLHELREVGGVLERADVYARMGLLVGGLAKADAHV
jgi:hypothetical protein